MWNMAANYQCKVAPWQNIRIARFDVLHSLGLKRLGGKNPMVIFEDACTICSKLNSTTSFDTPLFALSDPTAATPELLKLCYG